MYTVRERIYYELRPPTPTSTSAHEPCRFGSCALLRLCVLPCPPSIVDLVRRLIHIHSHPSPVPCVNQRLAGCSPCRCRWPPTNTFDVCLIMNFTQAVRIGDDWDDRQPSLSTTLLVEVLPTLNILCAQSGNEYNTS